MVHILLLLAQEVRGDSVQAVAGQLVVALQGSEPSTVCGDDTAEDGAAQLVFLGAGPACALCLSVGALRALLCHAYLNDLP